MATGKSVYTSGWKEGFGEENKTMNKDGKKVDEDALDENGIPLDVEKNGTEHQKWT